MGNAHTTHMQVNMKLVDGMGTILSVCLLKGMVHINVACLKSGGLVRVAIKHSTLLCI